MRILAILELGFSIRRATLRLSRLLANAVASCLNFCGLEVSGKFCNNLIKSLSKGGKKFSALHLNHGYKFPMIRISSNQCIHIELKSSARHCLVQ